MLSTTTTTTTECCEDTNKTKHEGQNTTLTTHECSCMWRGRWSFFGEGTPPISFPICGGFFFVGGETSCNNDKHYHTNTIYYYSILWDIRTVGIKKVLDPWCRKVSFNDRRTKSKELMDRGLYSAVISSLGDWDGPTTKKYCMFITICGRRRRERWSWELHKCMT